MKVRKNEDKKTIGVIYNWYNQEKFADTIKTINEKTLYRVRYSLKKVRPLKV